MNIDLFLQSKGYSSFSHIKNKRLALISLINGCQACKSRNKPIAPDLENRPILFIGRTPTLDDFKENELLTSKSKYTAIVEKYIKAFRGVKQLVSYITVCNCYSQNPDLEDIALCKNTYFPYIFQVLKPTVIVYLGSTVAKQFYPNFNSLSENSLVKRTSTTLELFVTNPGRILRNKKSLKSTIKYLEKHKKEIREYVDKFR